MIVIEFGDGRTAPMTPPEALGAAFAAVIDQALTWPPEQRDTLNERWLAGPVTDDELDACQRIEDALRASGVGDWSPAFGQPCAPAEAGPYIDTLRLRWSEGAAAVAEAVLARDLGLVTADDFAAATRWWIARSLPLPPARSGARFAADAEHVEDNAAHIRNRRDHVAGWPLTAVR